MHDDCHGIDSAHRDLERTNTKIVRDKNQKRKGGPAEDGGDVEDENAGARFGGLDDKGVRHTREAQEKRLQTQVRNAKYKQTKPKRFAISPKGHI